MLGLGTNLIKGGGGVRNIVTDSLVLRHDYDGGAVQPLSDGAAYFVSGDIVGLGAKNGLGSSTTVTAWVWAKDVTSKGAIITFGDTMIRFDSSTSLKVFPDVSGGASTGTFNNIIGRWVHVGVTMTINGSNCDVLIYEDGALIRAETETSVPSTDSRESSIGSYVGGSFWSGYVCNVGLWNATLSQAQIKSIMNKNYAGLTSSEKEDLVSWWNLDSTINEDYASTSETDADPSTITGLTLDNHDTTFTETSITNSDFTSGSGTTITGWTNDGNQWTRVDDTVVSGTSAQLLRMPSALENNTAHKIIIRAKRTTLDSAAILSVYIGGNNYAKHSLTNDFVEYITHGLQANDTTLFLYNSSDTNVTIDWVKVYKYDGNVGNLL